MSEYEPAADSARSYYAAVEAKRLRGDTTWKKPLPEYSTAMLRLMLEARAVLARDDLGWSVQRFAREFARQAGVPPFTVTYALNGRLKDPARRASLWAALGYYPGLSGIVLTDDGGQRNG